jgi:hypothetical protein
MSSGVKKISKPKSRPQKTHPAPKAGTRAEQSTALYLYCITEKNGGHKVAAAGVDGAGAVQALRCGDFWCWVSEVSRRDFSDRLNDHMQNLEWLAEASVRHQQVVAKIAVQADVLPARFATVFLSAESLCQDVKRRGRELRRGFARVRGCDEWGVKIYALSRPVPQPTGELSGRGYLERKSQMLESAMRGRGKADPAIEGFAKELEAISRESVAAAAVSRGQPGVVWQRSFLIARRNREKLIEALEKYARLWRDVRRIECTGPWPPYSFVSAGEQAMA